MKAPLTFQTQNGREYTIQESSEVWPAHYCDACGAVLVESPANATWKCRSKRTHETQAGQITFTLVKFRFRRQLDYDSHSRH